MIAQFLKLKVKNIYSKYYSSNSLVGLEVLPICLCLVLIALLFVLVRMKGIEQDYKLNDINSQVTKALYENRDLKARRAKLLSTKNLRGLAGKFKMESPKQNQIIVVP